MCRVHHLVLIGIAAVVLAGTARPAGADPQVLVQRTNCGDRQALHQALRNRGGALTRCLEDHPTPVALTVELSGSGRVRAARSRNPVPGGVLRCLQRRMRALAPLPTSGSTCTFTVTVGPP